MAGESSAKPLHNFMMLLDDFFAYKSKQMSHDLDNHLHPHLSVEVTDDDLEYENYTLEEPARDPPLRVFDAQPVVARRIITLHVQPRDEETVDLLLASNSWNYRSRLDALNVSGAYFEDGSGQDKRTYYRVMRDVNVSEAEQKDTFVSCHHQWSYII